MGARHRAAAGRARHRCWLRPPRPVPMPARRVRAVPGGRSRAGARPRRARRRGQAPGLPRHLEKLWRPDGAHRQHRHQASADRAKSVLPGQGPPQGRRRPALERLGQLSGPAKTVRRRNATARVAATRRAGVQGRQQKAGNRLSTTTKVEDGKSVTNSARPTS